MPYRKRRCCKSSDNRFFVAAGNRTARRVHSRTAAGGRGHKGPAQKSVHSLDAHASRPAALRKHGISGILLCFRALPEAGRLPEPKTEHGRQADSLNRSALCDVGVNAGLRCSRSSSRRRRHRITRSSVPSGFPGHPAAIRLRPRRADSFCSVPPLPPAWEERHLDKDYFANNTVSACRSMTKHPNNQARKKPEPPHHTASPRGRRPQTGSCLNSPGRTARPGLSGLFERNKRLYIRNSFATHPVIRARFTRSPSKTARDRRNNHSITCWQCGDIT